MLLMPLKGTFNNALLNQTWIGYPCTRRGEVPTWHGIKCDGNGRVAGIVLENMGLVGSIKVDAFRNLTEISVLSFKNNTLWGNMMDFSFNQKLTRIDLSQNMLYGPISSSVLSLVMLESFSVQQNWMSGLIPAFNQATLTTLDLSHNMFYGLIPITDMLRRFGNSSYLGNNGLCGSPSNVSCDDVNLSNADNANKNGSSGRNDDGHKTSTSGLIFYALLLVCLVITIIFSAYYYMKSRKLKKLMKEVRGTSTSEKAGKKDEEEGEAVNSVGGQQEKGKLIFIGGGTSDEFELGDILKASAEGLGRGIFGNSYKAKMAGKEAVVVKRIRDLKPLVNEEFNKQLQLIAKLNHPNLLPLLAYYYTKEEKLLLYRYARHGNLFNRLFGSFL